MANHMETYITIKNGDIKVAEKLKEIFTPTEGEHDVWTQILAERIFGEDKIDCSYGNTELELAKYAHNCFGALKVTYFNMIYDLCLSNELDYEKVLEVVLGSGYINENHTKIGLDGRRGYGGKCFPNNMENFKNYSFMESHKDLAYFLFSIEKYNERIRH